MDNTEGEPWSPGSLPLPPSPPDGWLPCLSHQLLLFPLPQPLTAAAANSRYHQASLGTREQAEALI